MIDQQKTLAVIPARGGSKGIPHKNLRLFAGKPLIDWTIAAAQASRLIDRVIVSTDDQQIHQMAAERGVNAPFLRPKELAVDSAPAVKAVMHAIEMLPEYDWVVMLQPTSPLRTAADIDSALETCKRLSGNFAVSVSPARKPLSWHFRISGQGLMVPAVPDDRLSTQRQGSEPIYLLNGAIYIAKSQSLLKSGSFINSDTVAFAMPVERSIDIDDEFDWRMAECLANQSPE